jgi:pimeloyl-ACP methyl ester carboxylesterase
MTASRYAELAASSVAGASPGRHHLVMLHGIYGRGRNWQPIARRVAAERPDYTCWLVDLRHHGASAKDGESDTLAGLAGDVAHWMTASGIEATATLGHSYGGKVALALAGLQQDVTLQTWVIDSTPEVKPPGGSAWEMLRVVRGLPERFSTRDEAIAGVVAGGFSEGVAQWMSTNLERVDDSFRWALDFDVMERLLIDFFATDLWPVLARPGKSHDIHIVKATESSVISPEAVARLQTLEESGAPVHLHQLEGGHWIHAEAPDAVAGLLLQHLPR